MHIANYKWSMTTKCVHQVFLVIFDTGSFSGLLPPRVDSHGLQNKCMYIAAQGFHGTQYVHVIESLRYIWSASLGDIWKSEG